MRFRSSAFLAGVALVSTLAVAPAHGQLLKTLTGGTGDVLSVQSGSAGDSSLVNVGTGGDGSGVEVNVGGGSAGTIAFVGTTTNDGVGVTLSTGTGAEGNVNLLGSGGLLTGGVDTGVGVGVDFGAGEPIDQGGPGGPGSGGIIALAGLSQSDIACIGPDALRMLEMAQSTSNVAEWSRASNVQIVPIRLCPDARRKVLAALRSSGLGHAIWSASASDALVVASLSRSPYSSENVLAVQRRGNQLTVFVI